MSKHDKLAGILSSLHEAALDDSLWPVASGRIDEACGIRGNTLVIARGYSQVDIKIFFARVCHLGDRNDDWEQTYFTDYYPLDERVPRVTRLPDSRLVHVAHLYTKQERKTSATYNKALPLAGYQNGLNVRLDGPEGTSIFWALADSTRAGSWGSRQIKMIESLLPHLRHFVRVRRALGSAQAFNTSLAELLGHARLGVIQLDRVGRILEMNNRARGLLQVGHGVFERDGFLRARVPADDSHLQGLLADAMPRFGLGGTGNSMTILGWPSRSRQAVHVLPIGEHQSDFGMGRVRMLVVVVEPGRPARLDAELVASALGLTVTESQVAVALAMGKTVSQIAEEKGVKASTVQSHIRRIHAKLGLSCQEDLIRLVLSLGDAPGPGRQ